MNRCLLALAAIAIQVSPLIADNFNVTVDRQILTAATSSTFQNVVLNYPFEGSVYPIRIIYNPEKKPLWASTWSAPKYNELTLFSDLPYILAAHIEKMIAGARRSSEKPSFYLTEYDALEAWSSIEPVYIAETIDDPVADAIAQKVFSSTEFVNQVLYYHIGDKYGQVRLLHNPEGRSFSASQKYHLTGQGEYTYTLNWNYKFGVFALYPVDSRLIDHLSRLANASYREWYFNFDVSNALLETYEIDTWNYTETFYLDTKFEYAEDFH
ncbi:MAG TPA: hypothetical protein VIJ46_05610 [Rhabdochlamydiaceae bacterium]